jgi:hypothetical protein
MTGTPACSQRFCRSASTRPSGTKGGGRDGFALGRNVSTIAYIVDTYCVRAGDEMEDGKPPAGTRLARIRARFSWAEFGSARCREAHNKKLVFRTPKRKKERPSTPNKKIRPCVQKTATPGWSYPIRDCHHRDPLSQRLKSTHRCLAIQGKGRLSKCASHHGGRQAGEGCLPPSRAFLECMDAPT